MCRNLYGEFDFWEHLTQTQKETVCSGTSITAYHKGQTVHSPGEKCLGIMLVKHGQLRVYMLSEDGREITLYRIFENETCILSASCVLDAITFDVFIDAEEDTEVFLLNTPVFHAIAQENIYVQAFAYRLTTQRFSDVMWAMQQILFMGVDKRLAIFLLDETAKTGSDEIQMTHEQMAKYMGTAREVVSRMLKYFSSEGMVELHRGVIKISDKQKLRALL